MGIKIKKILLALIATAIFFQVPVVNCTTQDGWSELLTDYPTREKDTFRKRTLKEVWSGLLKKYPYPTNIISKSKITYKDLTRVPSIYQRNYQGLNKKNLLDRLLPFERYIEEASILFSVPKEIIGAVILQESGGDPNAKAKDTSAKGLMQTIDSTFLLAKSSLKRKGIIIKDPLVPRDSILAGTWYLSQCFQMAKDDSITACPRHETKCWRKALEYYFAGPGWGRDPRPILYIQRQGKIVKIHKAKYSDGVLQYAFTIAS